MCVEYIKGCSKLCWSNVIATERFTSYDTCDLGWRENQFNDNISDGKDIEFITISVIENILYLLQYYLSTEHKYCL